MKKHFTVLVLGTILVSNMALAQTGAVPGTPYITTSARVDSLILPDRIHLTIVLSEKDTRGKIAVEELEKRMADRLVALGIDVSRQLAVSDLSSDFKRYFLKQQDVLKAASYSLLLYDAVTTIRVILALEEEGISNVSIEKTGFSREGALRLELKRLAVIKARENAEAMIAPLGRRVGAVFHVSDSPAFNQLAGQVAGLRVRKNSDSKFYNPLDVEFQKILVTEEVSVLFGIE